MTTSSRNTRRIFRWHLKVGAILFLATAIALALAAYSSGLNGPFLLDDDANIPQTKVNELTVPSLSQQFFSGERLTGASRGITRVSFTLTQYFGDGSPFWFKYQNLILHLINGLLAFWLFYLLARQRGLTRSNTSGSSTAPAWFAVAITALWLLHPLHVSTVLYAVQRLVLLASLFMLAALICYVKGRILAQTRPAAGAVLALVGVGLFGMLGLLSKESAALLPLLVLLIEWFFFRLRFTSTRERRAMSSVLLLVVALPLAAGLWVFIPQIETLWGWHPGRGFSGAERLMTQAHVIALYLKLFFITIPGNMSLYHDNFPITHALDSPTLLLMLGYMAAIIGALALRQRAPWIGFGILWFFACHLLESTVIPLELVFEHRSYLAYFGLAIALVAAVLWLLDRFRLPRLGVPLLVAVVVLLSFNTWARSTTWGDKERLMLSEYQRDPKSVRVLTELVNLASARGDQRAMRAYLGQLLALDIPDAGPELAALQLSCRASIIPTELYAMTQAKLENGRLSPFAVHGLGQVANLVLRGDCPALAATQLADLVDRAIQNTQPLRVEQRCLAREIQVRLFIDQGNWDAAMAALGTTLDRCDKAQPRELQFIVENILRFATCRDKMIETLDLFERAVATDSRRRTLDRAYAGMGGFDLDKLLGIDGAEDPDRAARQ